jgi:hypothetical protein
MPRLGAYAFRFALADNGNVMLVGVLPRASITVAKVGVPRNPIT